MLSSLFRDPRVRFELRVLWATTRAVLEDLRHGLRVAAAYPVAVARGYLKARRHLLTGGTRAAEPRGNATGLEHRSDVVLTGVHDPAACAGGPCPVHRRSDHAMRPWPQHFRGDRGFMERVCPHGVGHPDPDDRFADQVHGCDGCCRRVGLDYGNAQVPN